MVSRADFDRLATAVFAAAVGVMIAALAAALLWPPPAAIAGGEQAAVLGSQLQQVRLEPREKGFLAFAVAAGFLLALAALAWRRPRIRCAPAVLVLLALAAAVVNFCCDPALNDASGAGWALGGLAAVLALAFAAVRLSR